MPDKSAVEYALDIVFGNTSRYKTGQWNPHSNSPNVVRQVFTSMAEDVKNEVMKLLRETVGNEAGIISDASGQAVLIVESAEGFYSKVRGKLARGAFWGETQPVTVQRSERVEETIRPILIEQAKTALKSQGITTSTTGKNILIKIPNANADLNRGCPR